MLLVGGAVAAMLLLGSDQTGSASSPTGTTQTETTETTPTETTPTETTPTETTPTETTPTETTPTETTPTETTPTETTPTETTPTETTPTETTPTETTPTETTPTGPRLTPGQSFCERFEKNAASNEFDNLDPAETDKLVAELKVFRQLAPPQLKGDYSVLIGAVEGDPAPDLQTSVQSIQTYAVDNCNVSLDGS
ncbi:MAG: hypothetical protein WKF76_01020 [Nocardioidaceae bacterium]